MKKTILKYSILSLIGLGLFVACESDSYMVASVRDVPDNLDFTASASKKPLNVTVRESYYYDYGYVYIASDQRWCEVDYAYNNNDFNVSVETNNTGAERYATITIYFDGQVVKKVNVKQEAF
jgi:hypothetical protein